MGLRDIQTSPPVEITGGGGRLLLKLVVDPRSLPLDCATLATLQFLVWLGAIPL